MGKGRVPAAPLARTIPPPERNKFRISQSTHMGTQKERGAVSSEMEIDKQGISKYVVSGLQRCTVGSTTTLRFPRRHSLVLRQPQHPQQQI